jgi:diaminopimelate decarboxylase
MPDHSVAVPRYDREALAKTETPAYIFDPETVRADYEGLKAALGTRLVVSLKANPTVDLMVRCLDAFTDGLELASIAELNQIVGRAAVPKFVNTPALDSALADAALASRDTTLVLDSLRHLDLVVASPRKPANLAVALRINAASLLGAAMRPAHADHFGMDLATLRLACQRLRAEGIGLKGLNVFAGSYSFQPYGKAICQAVAGLLDEIEALAGAPLAYVNLGGGFPEGWEGLSADFAAYRPLTEQLAQRVAVMHEAGRAVFSRCGAFLTRVLAVKRLGAESVVVCDGGLAQAFLLAQTETPLKRLRRPEVIAMGEDDFRPAAGGRVCFVGNSCSRQDVIGEMPDGPLPAVGDLVRFDRCGAYTTYTPTGFLSLKAAGRHLVS